MKEIKLSQGKIALVDDEDFEYLNQFKWHAFKHRYTFYAARHIIMDGKYRKMRMHKDIMQNIPINRIIDHADRDGLNNQKYNLRICTLSQNSMNKKAAGKSIYLGVSFFTRKNKSINSVSIVSQIRINGINKYLGSFKTEEDAARAYDKAAKEHHKNFANLNFR